MIHSMTFRDLLEQAMALPIAERRQVAAKLIASADPEAWSVEDLEPELRAAIQASYAEAARGEAVPFAEVLGEFRKG